MTNIEFIGTWKLVSWESKSSDGKISQPFGQNPVGYLTYTEDRHMSVAIMKKNRLNIEITSQELTKARLVFLKPWLLQQCAEFLSLRRNRRLCRYACVEV